GDEERAKFTRDLAGHVEVLGRDRALWQQRRFVRDRERRGDLRESATMVASEEHDELGVKLRDPLAGLGDTLTKPRSKFAGDIPVHPGCVTSAKRHLRRHWIPFSRCSMAFAHPEQLDGS